MHEDERVARGEARGDRAKRPLAQTVVLEKTPAELDHGVSLRARHAHAASSPCFPLLKSISRRGMKRVRAMPVMPASPCPFVTVRRRIECGETSVQVAREQAASLL